MKLKFLHQRTHNHYHSSWNGASQWTWQFQIIKETVIWTSSWLYLGCECCMYSIYSTQSQPHTSATHPYPSADSSGSYQRSQTPDPKPKAAPYTHKPKIIDLIWSDLSPNKPPQPSSLPAFRIYYLLILELHTHLPTHTHTAQTLPSHPRYIHS